MLVPVEFVEGRPVSVQLPDVLEVRIAATAPPIHQQQDNTWKPARLENGVEIMVPQFIKDGDLIRLDMTSLRYMDRRRERGSRGYFFSTTPKSPRILGAGSSIASRLWQALQSCVILRPSALSWLLVVAAEAAREIGVADVVGIGAPVDLHLREDVAVVDRQHAAGRRAPLRPCAAA